MVGTVVGASLANGVAVGVRVGGGASVGARVGAVVGANVDGAGVVTPSDGAPDVANVGAPDEFGPTVTQPATRKRAAPMTDSDLYK